MTTPNTAQLFGLAPAHVPALDLPRRVHVLSDKAPLPRPIAPLPLAAAAPSTAPVMRTRKRPHLYKNRIPERAIRALGGGPLLTTELASAIGFAGDVSRICQLLGTARRRGLIIGAHIDGLRGKPMVWALSTDAEALRVRVAALAKPTKNRKPYWRERYIATKAPQFERLAQRCLQVFWALRGKCAHYTAARALGEHAQCSHAAHDAAHHLCALDCCPALRERAQAERADGNVMQHTDQPPQEQ